MNNLQLGNEIGRGGFGTVYEIKRNPALCVKVSNKQRGCRAWSDENAKIHSMLKNISEGAFDLQKLSHVKIVVPTEFHESSGDCYMFMPRIYRPEGKNYNDWTIQAQIGYESCRIVHKGRGEFIGEKEISAYVGKKNLDDACLELGTCMGAIHYIGKNDAYDIELWLGREYRKKKSCFYISDFDLTNEIKEFDQETINRMNWSLDAVPYFPIQSLNSHRFALFKQGYGSIVPSHITEKVFEGYG